MAADKLITLEEAAERLEITPSMFRQKLQTDTMFKTISKIRDGSTFRFKPNDIEELRRSLGFGSEEELQMADPSSDEMAVPETLKLAEADAPRSTKSPSSKKKIAPARKPADEDDDTVLRLTEAELHIEPDVFLMADEDDRPSRKSSSKIKPVGKKPDSDVRLGQSGKIKRPVIEEPSDEIELDILPRPGSSSRLGGSGRIVGASPSKLPGPKSGKIPAMKEDDSSEFELNLDADSSDEFELSLADDSSDEISLGDLPATSDGDSKAGLASGININRPRDAGVSLERSSKKLPAVKLGESGKSSKKLPKPQDDDEVDFELSLDQPGSSSKKLTSSKKLASSKKLEAQDSEFDLNLDDSVELAAEGGGDSFADVNLEPEDGKKNDIFETDFEIPALDDESASEAIALDEADTDLESSDFDLAVDDEGEIEEDDESGSQVVVLDDEIEEPVRKKAGKKKKKVVDEDDESDVSFDEMDLDESVSASRALKGLRTSDVEPVIEERVVVLQSAPWGVLPAIFMLPTVFVVFVAGLMAYEMMHSMWGYHQPTKPASLVIDNVADMLDMKPKE